MLSLCLSLNIIIKQLEIMKIKFFVNGIEEIKTNLTEKQKANIDFTAERFRQDMAAKHDILFTKTPHYVKIEY